MTTQIIHFSDPQLVPAGEINYDIDPGMRLQFCVDAILQECPNVECGIITGDLTHWGEVSAYQLLRKELERLPFPCYLLMGDHDRRECFFEVFPEHPQCPDRFVQYVVNSSAGCLICLDTLEEGKRSGLLCPQRLDWLQEQLEEAGDKPVYLFMHHPPFKVGLASMDDDNLVNAAEFAQAIEPYRLQIRHIFFGHLHRSVSGSWNGISYSCPPSLVHQTPFGLLEKKVDKKPSVVSPEPPAYQLVQLHPDRVVVHTRHFLHSEPAINSRTCYRYQKPG